ncbi:HpcH/HpaI aldolase/citrate lyase family protein [Trujillonella endophytica]|uniref:Citrate lyase subunit beta / citryl-CoA lyase n=1 Tax=Trujillonella endophytica TaxID=673521 RepID=A0A1H8S854_9ACTN|nr:aldolase/citrate lyase family protein [Trujillella endophytica]SEO74841.1 citrate lyase subunit beta / citryl-CoA lyase [Trujillella endophytica]
MTAAPPAPRVCLVVPASDQRKVDKALAADVDEVVLDLEDAVAPAAKGAARARVREVVAAAGRAGSLAVRVNQVGSAWCHRDVLDVVAAAQAPVTLVVPKVDSAVELHVVDRLVRGARAERAAAGSPAPVIRLDALVESAAALRSLDAVVAASDLLRALVVGYADLAADLGRDPDGDPAAWDPVRSAVVAAARAGRRQLIDGPWLSVAADETFLADRDRARRHGFDGTWVIHPAQVADATRIFTPSAEQLEWARRVLAAMDEATAAGAGAVSLDGQMLDEALAVRARSVLARAGRGAAL